MSFEMKCIFLIIFAGAEIVISSHILRMIGFVIKLCKRLPNVSYLSTSTLLKQPYNPKDNPGIYRRLKLISEDEPDVERANIDADSLEDLEQDWMGAADMHDEAASEMQAIKRKADYKMIERKYFKLPKEPNMLTWSEKEQIRLLHRNDPKQWTPQVLAESFPATPDVIKKLLRSKWTPRSAERLKEHDQSVSENWIAFHKGKLKIHDLRLQVHLKKFIDRKYGVQIISDEDAKKATEINFPMPKRSEFLSLITSFKSGKDKASKKIMVKPEEKVHPMKEIKDGDPFALIHNSRANYTLDHFRQRVKEEMSNMPNPPDDLKALMEKENSNLENNNSKEGFVAPSERFLPDAKVYQKQSKSTLQLADPNNLADKIMIPKDQWEPGKIYKVKDSFYNDRGMFLYRVPGLK